MGPKVTALCPEIWGGQQSVKSELGINSLIESGLAFEFNSKVFQASRLAATAWKRLGPSEWLERGIESTSLRNYLAGKQPSCSY